jgi:hypothetical protein
MVSSLDPNATATEAQREFATSQGIAAAAVLIFDDSQLITDGKRPVSSLLNPSIVIGRVCTFKSGASLATLPLAFTTTV